MAAEALELDSLPGLLLKAARIGREHPGGPPLSEVDIFKHWFDEHGLLREQLDEFDGSATRRELLARFLLLNVVLDQGPDIAGVRELVVRVTNDLYRKETRFLHDPLAFFRQLGLAVSTIQTVHEAVKACRAAQWAQDNETRASKYNLFIDANRQVLQFAIFRWGMPLALPLLLMRHAEDRAVGDKDAEALRATALLDYLESYESSEEMSYELNHNRTYGLGKAIGEKAAHVYAKWLVSSYKLTRRTDAGWGTFSFEVPFDSNIGRVLWRTGFLLACADLEDYKARKVVQRGEGKKGKDYIRVTNIRGMKVKKVLPNEWVEAHHKLCVEHLKTHLRGPRSVFIQRLPSAILLAREVGQGLGPAELDDGLVHIGTQFCFNTSDPLCDKCPVKALCCAGRGARELIEKYAT